MHPMLTIAIRAARSAGRIINRASVDIESIRVTRKQVNDFVTEVDRASEQIVVETLLESFPAHSILAEESGFIAGPKCRSGRASNEQVDPASPWFREAELVWIIDPIDGTTNFIHGLPLFSISIALAFRGKTILGVVHEVSRDECFSAIEGGRAMLNGKVIQVSERSKLSDSLLVTGFPYKDEGRLEAWMQLFITLLRKSHGVRRLGSAAIDLVYVACGRFEAFYEYGLSPWDVAAGAFIVEQAGGLVTDYQGGPNFVYGKELLAGNGRMNEELRGVILEHFAR